MNILEKRQWASLKLIKEADGYARRLIAVRPDEADAWLALGAATSAKAWIGYARRPNKGAI